MCRGLLLWISSGISLCRVVMKLDHVLKAVASSWVAVSVNAVVGFLLTPYLLHDLGAVEFRLYTLAASKTKTPSLPLEHR